MATFDGPRARRARTTDRIFRLALLAATISFVLLVAALFWNLLSGSFLSLKTFGVAFLWTSQWNPVTGRFGALPLIYGTIVSSAIAILLAAIVGVFAAAYLADFAPRLLAQPLSFVIELLAAVPSVVFGLWGLFVLAPMMRSSVGPFLQTHFGWLPVFAGPIYGPGLLTAGIILAIMIVPTVTAISRDVIVAVAAEQREASMSLGATRWETMQCVILPASRSGIFGACVLALGRALGETIATTMVIGNRPAITASLFAPSYTLSSVIANEFTEATSDLYLSALVELALILFIVSMLVNGCARVLTWTVLRSSGRAR
ncbi:MAG: phosphate ABC transporter permease subunit PstC [Candidatus Velthaea sp.]